MECKERIEPTEVSYQKVHRSFKKLEIQRRVWVEGSHRDIGRSWVDKGTIWQNCTIKVEWILLWMLQVFNILWVRAPMASFSTLGV